MMVSSMIEFFLILYVISFYLVMNSDDWFLIWLGMEINMMSFIFMIYMRESLMNVESCLKYFFVQSLGSVLFVSMFYFSGFEGLWTGSVILGYKMGAAPFYFWFPSVCEGTGWLSCFFLMTFQSLIPLMIMVSFIGWVIWVMVVMSLISGALGSFNQSSVSRLMAYSSVHHIGWLFMCVMMSEGLWMAYIVMYMFMVLPVVVFLYFYEVNDVSLLFGLSSSWIFILMLLGMGGMPPFLGFFLKWLAFIYILELDVSVVGLMVIVSVVMFYVYVRMVYDGLMMYKEEMSWGGSSSESMSDVGVDVLGIVGMMIGGFVGVIFMM